MKMDIALGILLTTLNKEIVTAQELSSKFVISTRTVYRYVNFLDLSGVPIITKPGKNGGISIVHKFNLKNLYFTNIELLQLITLCSAITDKSLQTNLQTKLLYLLHNHI